VFVIAIATFNAYFTGEFYHDMVKPYNGNFGTILLAKFIDNKHYSYKWISPIDVIDKFTTNKYFCRW